MPKKYVIRGYNWGYNDEIYYPTGSYIHAIFDNKKKAQAKYQALELEHWRDFDLGESGVFFDGDEQLCEQINKFVLEKCGKTVFDNVSEARDSFIPDELSNQDAMTVIKMAELTAYKITEFDNLPKYFVIWFAKEKKYLVESDEYSTSLVYEESQPALVTTAKEAIEYHWDDSPLKIKGDFSEISDNPSALEKIIATTKGLKYNSKKQRLEINTEKVDALFTVNDLLKNPLFEIKSLTIKQVQKIEKELQNNDNEW